MQSRRVQGIGLYTWFVLNLFHNITMCVFDELCYAYRGRLGALNLGSSDASLMGPAAMSPSSMREFLFVSNHATNLRSDVHTGPNPGRTRSAFPDEVGEEMEKLFGRAQVG